MGTLKAGSRVTRKVQFLLNKAEQTDVQKSEHDFDLLAEIARCEHRLEALAAAKAKIAERVRARDQQETERLKDCPPEAQQRAKKNLAGGNTEHRKPAPAPKIKSILPMNNHVLCPAGMVSYKAITVNSPSMSRACALSLPT